jgi:hypothetical protein
MEITAYRSNVAEILKTCCDKDCNKQRYLKQLVRNVYYMKKGMVITFSRWR